MYLFISFEKGNLTHDFTHLCDVVETPAAPADRRSVFLAADKKKIKNQPTTRSLASNRRTAASKGRRTRRSGRKVTDAKPGNLSFNLQPYIGHFEDRHILFTHEPLVS